MSNNAFGTLSSVPDGSIIEHIYNYIYVVLQDFNGTSDENENGITNKLCKTLEYKKPPECPYFFHHQNIENDKENTSTDFAVFGTFAYAQRSGNFEEAPPLLKIEAKRLSTTLPKNREREYVIGEYEKGKRIKNSGGIERFKNGRHGNDVTNACLIGYMQTNSFTHWTKKINGWIQDEIIEPSDNTLSWDSEDILGKVKIDNKTCIYTSKSKRHLAGHINLRHLWVDLS
jgi:hypothetical protein